MEECESIWVLNLGMLEIKMTRRSRVGRVIYEFTDGENTYAVIDWGRYVEIAHVLVNYDKKDGSLSK